MKTRTAVEAGLAGLVTVLACKAIGFGLLLQLMLSFMVGAVIGFVRGGR